MTAKTGAVRLPMGVVPGVHGFGRSVATTATFNIAHTVAVGVAGVIIARSLGVEIRGEYAAIMAWFGVVLIVGELGQTAATTFFVARHPSRGRDHLATSRNMMVVSGLVTLSLGVVAAPALAHGDAMTWGYRLMFATCLGAFVGASYTFSLQATNIARWNVARISQPLLFVGAVSLLALLGSLTLLTALGALSAALVTQVAIAYALCRRQGLTGGRGDWALARPMTRYGLSQLAASGPSVITARLDQLVLSLTVAPAILGSYAVATSLMGLAVPVVSAVGSVAFPRIASRVLSPGRAAHLQRWSILACAGIGLTLVLALAVASSWLVPVVFGADYRPAVALVWWLAPGGVFLACGQVCGDFIRGYGEPLAVARAQGLAAVVTIVLLAVLLPALGVIGAAIASSVATGVALLHMLRTLRRLSPTAVVTVPPSSDPAPRSSASDLP